MVVAFSVTTWSFQRVSQMEHKDLLDVTCLKIAICYRNDRHVPPHIDRCPYDFVFLMKGPNN
jgi:hypothetical protein